MTRPGDIMCATEIRATCSDSTCDASPAVVATVPDGDAHVKVMWACDYHSPDLAGFAFQHGVDHADHVFEVVRTCRADGKHGTPCGAAADYLVVCMGGSSVISVCKRHLEEWRPQPKRGF